MPHRIQGIWAAAVTPLTAGLDIDHPRLAAYTQALLEAGNHGVALFGSTGEGNSFTVGERAEAVERLAAAGLPMEQILVGTGACAFPDAVTLSRVAHDAGAAGVLFHPPFYYKEPSEDGLLAYFDRLVTGVGDDLRIVLYHFPRLVGVGYSEAVIARLIDEFPDQVIGTKDSSGDVQRMVRLAESHPGLAVLAGNEKVLLEVLRNGGAGCLTATTNLTAPLAREVWEAFVGACGSPGPEAAALQVRLGEARTALESAPFIAGIKRLLADRDRDEAWIRVRPPQQPLDPARATALREAAAPYLREI